MKRTIFTLILIGTNLIVAPANIYGATLSPTAGATTSASMSPTISVTNTQINTLKDRIASRVAQLKLVDKRGIIGTVTDVSGNAIVLMDLHDNTRLVDVDELTKFESTGNKTFGLSDLSKGTKITVIGLYNKESKRILARFIDLIKTPKVINGVVSSIDKKNFNLHIATLSDPDLLIDIETTTKIYQYGQGNLSRLGLSKIAEGVRILVIGINDTNNKNMIVASRITLLPDIPINPRLNNQNITPSGSASPSGSLSPKPTALPTNKTTK